MKRFIFLALIALSLLSCKKKSSTSSPIDYSCDCSKYGKNIINFTIDHPVSLYPANNDMGNWGYMNSSGALVINASYKEVDWFSHNLAVVWLEPLGDFKAGIISTDGGMVLNATYSNLGSYFSSDGLIRVGDYYQNWGYMNSGGQIVINYNYSDAQDFHEGRAVVEYTHRYGAIDSQGNMIIPNTYAVLGNFSEGKACAGGYKAWLGYIDKNNNEVIRPIFSGGGIFANGFAEARDTTSTLWGFIDSRGTFKIPPLFVETTPFFEYLAAVKKNSKWGFIDTLGNFVVSPIYDDITGGFCENLAGVKSGDLWGFVDKTGSVIIQPKFKGVDVFYCGLAMVLFDDNHIGYIDNLGNTIWKSPIQSLQNTFLKNRRCEQARRLMQRIEI